VSEQPLLTLTDVTIGYDRQTVLRDICLQIRRGSFTGLAGANGSGKTTLLKTILGVLPPLAGRIELNPLAGRAPVLGYVPQRETLDPIFLLSSQEVVLMGAYGRIGAGRLVPPAERDWAQECLRQTGTTDLRRRRFSELSGGQKQRVLIARALAARPDLLVLDEPTAGVDPAAAQIIRDLLDRLHREQRMTILLVNHDLPALRQQVDEVIWLREGRVHHGPASELLRPEQILAMLNLTGDQP
jgi:ABC-type Mn2+/Zn2+ transport system ATPase subunit